MRWVVGLVLTGACGARGKCEEGCDAVEACGQDGGPSCVDGCVDLHGKSAVPAFDPNAPSQRGSDVVDAWVDCVASTPCEDLVEACGVVP